MFNREGTISGVTGVYFWSPRGAVHPSFALAEPHTEALSVPIGVQASNQRYHLQHQPLATILPNNHVHAEEF